MADFNGEPATVLDPGRERPGPADVTELDPGRSRPPVHDRPFPEQGLPPLLDARFAVVRVLTRAASEADVYLVRERSTGDERVVKLYRDATRDRRVRAFLERKQDPHIVTVFEAGTEGDRDYEVLEHLGGGSLAALREAHPDGLDPASLSAVVRQLAGALAELHAAGFVHRDVKPANAMVRTLSPLDVALVDFGISLHLPAPATIDDRSGTVRFMAPEFLGGRLMSSAYDWWALGLTVRELAIGRPLLDGASDDALRIHVTGGSIAVHAIVDAYGKAMLTNSVTLQTKRDELKRLVAVTQRAYAACLIKPDPCLAALVKNVTGVDPTVAEGEWRRLSELMVSDDWKKDAVGWLDAQRIKSDYDLIATYMGVDHPYDPNKAFTQELLDKSIKLAP